MIISRWIRVRMRNVSDKSCREKQNRHFAFINYFLTSCRLWDMWKNIVEFGRLQMTIWRMCISYWIPNATNTHSEYVILFTFLLQQWLHERVLLLHCTRTYIDWLVWVGIVRETYGAREEGKKSFSDIKEGVKGNINKFIVDSEIS